jgi:hypothetical protein
MTTNRQKKDSVHKTAPDKQMKGVSLKAITESAKNELKELTGFVASSVTSVRKDGDEWKVVIELLEKEGIPDKMDILGIYETSLDKNGNLISYERAGLRKRGDTVGYESEEEPT